MCLAYRIAIPACFAPLFLGACSSEDRVTLPPPPGEPSFRWMNPVSRGASLSDVWGPAADNLLATGNGGIVLRFDGERWRRTQSPVSENLNAVWGADATHVFAVGQDGVILFFDGASWTTQSSPTTRSLNDVWGSSASDVYAVGQQREVIHFDGASWDTLSVVAGIENLYSVWGAGPRDVYAAGLGTKLLHYDGKGWGEVQTGASFALNAVWGVDSTHVFVVGGNGAASFYGGVAWTRIDVGETVFPNTVWGSAADDVYAMGFAAGAASPAYHWDGFAWSPVELNTYNAITRVFGVDGAVIAVGQAGLIHEKSDDGAFVAVNGGLTVDLEAVWVSSNGSEAFAAGDFGTILHFKDGAWTPMASGTTEHLRGLGGVCSCSVIAVGENGVVLRRDGSDWTDISPGTPVHFNEAWEDPLGAVFVVGDDATIMRLENSAWSPLSLGAVTHDMLSVWGSSPDNVYVVGAGSSVFVWNGTQFKNVVVTPGGLHNFHGVHGTGPDDVYVASELVAASAAVHAGGSIFHWDGAQWTSVFSDPVHDVLSVWRASADAGFATGDAASLLRDPTGAEGWARVFDVEGLPFYVNSVRGSSMSNVFVVADDGGIVRYSP